MNHHKKKVKDANTEEFLIQMHLFCAKQCSLSAGHLLLPFHLRESVVLYRITGSKLALTLLAGGGSHASYKQVKLFLNNLGTGGNINVNGDVLFVFDNNQVLHRWVDSKFHCHITMLAVFGNRYVRCLIE